MDEPSETQNLNIFAYKKKVKNSFLQNCAKASPNKFTDQELNLEPSNRPQNNHFNLNFEKWDILLDNTRQNSIDQASSPANKVISAAIQESDFRVSPVHQPLRNLHDQNNDSDFPLRQNKTNYENKENLIFTNDYQYQTPNHHHAKKESFDSVNLLSKSTTGTEKTHLDVILEEFSPQMEYHDQQQEADPELLIQIDVVQVSKSFAEYARKKVPRYIKKMQKHIKKIDHQLKHFDLEKDGLMELKNEVRNIHSWNSPWTYSRILLYLTNLLTYFKYKYRVDNEKFSEKLFKKVFKLATKSYFYARQIIKSLFITFNPEEIEAFERLKMEYQVFLEQRSAAGGEIQRDDAVEKLVKKEKSKKKKKKKHSRKEKEDSDDEDGDEGEDESKKRKKLKVEQQDEFQAEEAEEEEDDDLWRAEPKKEKKPKKNFDIKSILNKRRKKKKKIQNSNGETEVEKQAAIDLDNYFDKVTSHLHSTGFVADVLNSVLKTWKSHQQQPLEEMMVMKPEKAGPAIWEEVNQPQGNVSSLEFPSFSFNLNPKLKKANPSPAFSAATAGQTEDDEGRIETKIQQRCSPSLSSIFKLETLSPETMKINKDISLPVINRLLHKKLARKTTALFFTNSISQKLHGYLKWKGIDYQLNTQQMEREIFDKLVLLKFEFKLAEDDDEEEESKSDFNFALNVQNKFSVESFNSFLSIPSQIKHEKFTIQGYPELFSLEQMRHKTFGVVYAEKILEQLNTEPWRSDASSALYYYAQLLQDDEGDDYYELGVFTIVENFFDFHICFNEKQLF